MTSDAALTVIVVYGVLNVLILVARTLLGGGLFDRYLWGVALAVVILLLRRVHAPVSAARAVVLACFIAGLFLLSTINTFAGDEFRVARWEAGRQAVAAGYDPSDIDAGFEWVGYHYSFRVGKPEIDLRSRDPRSEYHEDVFFPAASNCVTVSASPMTESGLDLIRSVEWKQYWVAGERNMLVYRNPSACRAAGLGEDLSAEG